MAKAKSAAKADKKAATADAKALKVKAEAKKVRCGRKIWAVSLGVRTYGAQTRRSSACCDAETARACTHSSFFARASHTPPTPIQVADSDSDDTSDSSEDDEAPKVRRGAAYMWGGGGLSCVPP